MTAATATSCTACLRPIDAEQMFFMLDTNVPVCVGCMEYVGKRHDAIWPSCPDAWHDAYDHSTAYRFRVSEVGVRKRETRSAAGVIA